MSYFFILLCEIAHFREIFHKGLSPDPFWYKSPAHPWPLPMLFVLTTAPIEPLVCLNRWHTEQKHRPLLDKTYHNPSRWGGGGFQGHQARYSHQPETWQDLQERHCEVLVWDLVWHPWEEWWLAMKRIDYTERRLLPSGDVETYIVATNGSNQAKIFLFRKKLVLIFAVT